MLGALLTTVFFSLSMIVANRSIRAVGRTRANLGRLFVAVALLGAYAHTAGSGLTGAGLTWFLVSGVIGMGLGDLAMFAALPLLGARLMVLMAQCLAVPIAMLAERLWMDTRLTGAQVGWAVVIITGVVFALMPSRSAPPKVRVRPIGFLFGVFAAAGQGLGAVASRRGYEFAAAAGESIDGISAAYQRMLGGLVVTLLWFGAAELLRTKDVEPATPQPSLRAHGWILLNALCGPVCGVSCYQWALSTTPSGIVLPIVATAPLVIVPLAWWIEGERPTWRSLAAGVIAVAGVVALTLAAH